MKHLQLYENYKEIIGKIPVETSIKYLRIPKELKEVAISLISQYTKAKNGKITGLNLHPDLIRKINAGEYPRGFDMGIDKNGYFIHTHRVRSKSYKNPNEIPVKAIKFIDSTG